MELIKVTEKQGQQLVSARELHEFLEVGRDFTTWIKARIEKYDFVENEDFTIISLAHQNGGAHNKLEYVIKLDMAKELSMVENNEKGRKARKYFIEVEKTFKKLPVMSKLEMIVEIAQSQVETNKRIDRLENTMTIDSAKARAIQRKVGRRVVERIEKLEKIDSFGIKFLGITEWEKKISRKLFANIYRDLKNKFAVASYRDIRVVDYDRAIQFIQSWIEDSELLEDVK